MKKIVTIIGARPQFIKAAVVSRAIQQESNLNEVLVHTGQHYDNNMSQIFFDELDIPPLKHHLGVGSGTQGKQTGEMLASIEAILLTEKPDWVLIYGDTNSTLAGAIAASKLHIPIAHVEAGLRSYNRRMPEEINRIVADQLSEVLFTPTVQAVMNLKLEGYPADRIFEVGDVMYDGALFYAEKASSTSNITHTLACQDKNYILATIHRAENTDDPKRLAVIFSALDRLATTLPVILPLHPRTRKTLAANHAKLLKKTKIQIIDPLGFLDMVMLEKNAALIMTDSGGVQKEAFFYGVPCITLRDETEWLETVHLGWNKVLAPNDAEAIYQQAIKSIGTQGLGEQFPYGKGNAATLITNYLKQGIA